MHEIFEPFVQLKVALTRGANGVGLGLAISRDPARGMGGDLRARSDDGTGASFTLSLPAPLQGGNDAQTNE
ncbi:MAG: ATP-binding protein [Gemmatimonadaceae bacterium]